jgi:hypothetical protein
MNAPRRLADDPSAAPWLAERLRAASGPQPLPAVTRARVGEALSAALERRRGLGFKPGVLAGAVALGSVGAVVALLAFGQGGASTSTSTSTSTSVGPRVWTEIRREPIEPQQLSGAALPATPSSSAADDSVGTAASDSAARSEIGETRSAPRVRGAKARAGHRAATPGWLIEARAALATDPERTLALIRANRDPQAPIAPEVVELTLRALDAQRGVAKP